MKKIFLLIILTSSVTFCQDFQGKASYMSKINVDTQWMDNPRFASRRGYMEEMLKKNTEKNYVLEFSSTESFYSEKDKIDVGEAGSFNWMATYIGDNIGKLYKNLQEKVTINETEMMGKFFLITDPIEDMKWQITGETKKIGQYSCYKATYEKEIQERVFSFGSESQNQNNVKTKTVEVAAWFTPEIPVSTGPSWYQGLPGLILEVSDDNTTILCTKIVMNPTDKSKIKKPKRGKVINNVDFIALQDQKRQEAREMWQKMRRSGGGRPSRN
jgi:GLPGLI family protein